MSHTEQLKEHAQLSAYRALESASRVLESLSLDFSTIYGLDPRDLGIGDHSNFYPVPPAGAGLTWLNRLKRGEFIPAFLTEQQLSIYRRRIRAAVVNNEIALNAVNIHQSYAIGEGFKYEVTGRHPHVNPDLIRSAQAFVDAVCQHNDMSAIEDEILARVLIDGEAFLRAFPTRSGILALRFVEPEHVYSPKGETDHNSFGVITDPLDTQNVHGYWVVQGLPDQGSTPTPVPACEILHVKHPETPSTSKRGLSAFYPIETTLRAAEDLLISTVSMVKARAKIAWIRKLQGMTADVASALVAAQANVTATDPATGENLNMERIRYGTILTTNADIEMPAANIAASDHVAVMQMVLRVIAARFSMPEYLLSSDASNANYASTMVAESPWVKSMQRLQRRLARLLGENRWPGPKQSLIWRQLDYAERCGYLPPGASRVLDVQVTGPSLVVRNEAEESQVNKTYHDMKVKSVKTIQMEIGLDPDQEAANFEEEGPSEQEQMMQQQQQMQLQQQPPAPSTDALPPGETEEDDDDWGGILSGGSGEGEAEEDWASLFGEACVPNRSGPGYHDDQTGHSCSPNGDEPSGQGKQGWGSYLKQLPKKTYAAAKAKVVEKFKTLESRYGRKWAIAIMSAGIAGVPLPIPGSSILTAAPLILAAELSRRLTSN